MGVYQIDLMFQNKDVIKHPFYIIRGLNEKCILGLDFITNQHLLIDPRKRVITYLFEGIRKYIRLPEIDINGVQIEEDTRFKIPHLDREIASRIEAVLKKYSHVFVEDLNGLHNCTTIVQHDIRTNGQPVFEKMRRIPNALKAAVKARIDDLLKNGIIRESCSPYAMPLVIAPKKDGGIRMCVDYRKLNAITERDRFPLPRVDDTIDALHGSVFFSTLDLFSGYHQILINPEDQYKTGFICEWGQYEFVRMSFGLSNAPATFQRCMNQIFRSVLYKFVLIYMDDLILFSRSAEDHARHLEEVFKILEKAGFKLNINKCYIARKSIEFLGFVVSQEGISPNPEKVAAIRNYPEPRNVKQLQSFLGCANYYRRFVRNYADKAHALTRLTRKDVKWTWGDPEQKSFDCIKDCLTTSPVLSYPDFSKIFLVYTDSSGWAVGAVLSQMQRLPGEDDDREVVIAYTSKHLTDREKKWSTTELEAYAIIHAVTVFRPYLYGRSFIAITDHRSLEWLMSKREPAGRLARWACKLMEYDIKIGYRPGKTNQNADCLSRIPVNQVTIEFSDVENWKRAQERDEFCERMRKMIKEYPNISHRKYHILDSGLLGTKEGRIFVPRGLRKEVLQLNHDHMLAGHLGIAKTIARIQDRYTWPFLASDVTNYINGCLICAKQKSIGTHTAPLQSMPVPQKIWDTLAMDISGPIIESNDGHKYILVIMDYATRYIIACPMKDQTAKTVAKHFVKEVLLKYGAPSKVLSDQGKNFLSELMNEVCLLFNVTRLRTTAYHPQTDGLVERCHKTIKSMITPYLEEKPENWNKYLPFIILALNAAKHASTGYSPFYLLFGRDPSLATDLTPPFRTRSIDEFVEIISVEWKRALKATKINILKAQKVQKRNYDVRTKFIQYSIGDKVLLKLPETPGKFKNFWGGLYTIIDKKSDLNYVIKRDKDGKISLVHINRLKRFIPRSGDEGYHTEDRSIEKRKVLIIPKRKRGRPKKVIVAKAKPESLDKRSNQTPNSNSENILPKPRGRGRPRKLPMQSKNYNESNSESSSDTDTVQRKRSKSDKEQTEPTNYPYNLRVKVRNIMANRT